MRKLVSVLLTLAVVLGLSLTMAVPVAAADYDSSLTLENKNSTTWAIIADTTSGTLLYNKTGSTFDFSFSAIGLTSSTNYSLIYYADADPRFDSWGGNNPGALIAEFKTGSGGNIPTVTGSVELNMGLPCPPDWNIDPEPDYCGFSNGFDDYAHCSGAKIWLVPSECYNATECKVGPSWEPTRYLFETDLIWYDDTGSSVSLTVEVQDIVAISVNPTSINFGTLLPGSTSAVKQITVKNVGTRTVDVDADVDGSSSTLFYENLQMTNNASWAYRAWPNLIAGLAMNVVDDVQTQLVVPSGYTPNGTETGMLIFTATAA